MRLVERMIEELNRTWNGDAWYGPSLRPLLDGITEEQARAHPIANAHSILELVVHAAYWMDMTTRRITETPSTEKDWRDVAPTSWKAALAELERAYIALLDRVARMSDDDMNRVVSKKNYTIWVMLLGVIEHNVYHAGQIALVKKMLTADR